MVFVYIALAFISLGTRASTQNLGIDSIHGFSLKLFKDTLDNEYGNFIISPLSVSTLLAMVEVGSNRNSKQELRQLLQYPPESPNFGQEAYRGIIQDLINRKGKSKSTLEFASRMYISQSLTLSRSYQDSINRNFFAEARGMDFRNNNDAAERINNWVNQATKGKITSILQPDAISQDTRLILVNAIYFRGIWEKQFDPNRTTTEQFITDPNTSGRRLSSVHPSSLKLVPMMRQAGTFVAGTDPELRAKWIHLPFDNGEFSMVLVLPTDDRGINDLTRRLTKENIDKIIRTRSTQSVVLGLPRFKISTKLSLVDSLKRLGVQDIFGPSADLSGMSQNRLIVNNILHKAEIEVNEEGSTAAATTAVLVNTLSLTTSEDLVFYANQPFLVFLIKNNPAYPLFVGRVTDP